MSSSEPAEAVATRAAKAFDAGQAFGYAIDMADNYYPEILWSIYGLPSSEEIIVIVRAGALCLGKAATSSLLIPPMSDRNFGIDARDIALAQELSEELWTEQSARLISAALQRRGH